MTAQTAGLLAYLKTAEPWAGAEFIEGDELLLPLDEVTFVADGPSGHGPPDG